MLQAELQAELQVFPMCSRPTQLRMRRPLLRAQLRQSATPLKSRSRALLTRSKLRLRAREAVMIFLRGAPLLRKHQVASCIRRIPMSELRAMMTLRRPRAPGAVVTLPCGSPLLRKHQVIAARLSRGRISTLWATSPCRLRAAGAVMNFPRHTSRL